MGLISPTLPKFDVDEWRAKSRAERTKALQQHWAIYGFGTPYAIYILYTLKIGLYILGGLLFAASTPGIGGLGNVSDWWFEPVVFQKVIIWTLLFEVLGFGCGFGPLTMRFLPPLGTFLYWLRPGTIRQPPWPDVVRGTAGSRRTIVDIVLYLGVIAAAVYVLLSPADRAVTGLGDDAFNLIEPARFLPLLIVLPIMGLRDKTIFLAARSEHYWVTAIVFLFPFVDMIVAAKLLMVAIWWGAATSKLNGHFPFVVSTMMSNAPLVPKAVKRRLWRDAEFDVRPGLLARALAHGGTVIEFGVPLILLLSRGGWVTTIALIIMILFHLQILSAIPMGVPLEWNVLMMFGAVFLFGRYSEYGFTDVTEPFLPYGLLALVVATIVAGNLRPDLFSFLPSMRYYAGTWATSVWLFAEGAEDTYAAKVTKSAQLPHRQLAKLYDEDTVDLMIGKLGAWRGLHTHGRAMVGLYPHAAEDHEKRTIFDGEMVAGSAIGWNFGDGHLHGEALLAAIQDQCQFEPGELRVIMMESPPFFRPVQRYRIVDAATGVIETGEVEVAEMLTRQPWDGSLPFNNVHRP
ncbi:hypothetical protein J2X11_000009 [Aeromicrobium panaciterrae]|uniref:DUF3556 domain-containing protein n=1 Tax=Aeromicrobium panaciterrae TaxID=363861 RepID=A0ABU1UJ31_9ACTN|nr:DUF3556 domain-containing protein [Aeromicrobium panaciterrae]MDR7085170.1 hypothetical protein [Aeromicrobium panaciterrae]